MSNRHGAAGRRGISPEAALAFLDFYTTTDVIRDQRHRKRINGHVPTPSQVRCIRRWRTGRTEKVAPVPFLRLLHELDFNLPWFHRWCKQHGYKVEA